MDVGGEISESLGQLHDLVVRAGLSELGAFRAGEQVVETPAPTGEVQ